MKKPYSILIPALILLVLLSAALAVDSLPFPRLYLSLGALALSGITVGILHAILKGYEKRRQTRMDAIFADNNRISSKVIQEVSVPSALINGSGKVAWCNDSFAKLFTGENILDIMPSYQPAYPLSAFAFDYAGGSYLVKSLPVERKGVGEGPYTFMYWIDRTEAAHYQRLHEEQMPYVALIYVDNYEELTSDMQFHRTSVLAEVERLVSNLSQSLEGIYRRYESGRFLVVFEAKRLQELEEGRFPLLEQAHNIDTGTGATVSLSISVGIADRLHLSDESARQAMELALGRGGDQAVVKQGSNYRFYGGRMQLDSMQSRVKARLFSKALRQLFENAGDIFVMGHKHADMDCIGAAMGVITCAKHIGSRCFLVLDASNATIDKSVEQIRSNPAYAGLIISPEQAEKMLRPTSVLVVVDTQRPSTTAAPRLVELASRIVLIDHHRRSADYIDNATLHYLESRSSSASEQITEVLQYFDDNIRPNPFVSSALLAGITLDTKHFAFNVGARTFEAAAYLRRNGADISMVKQLFQDDLTSYTYCAQAVSAAEMLPGNVAVSIVGPETPNAKLTAARAADALIGIRGIEAAFVLGEENGVINLSGRSLGRVNAQLVCEKLGGGGHLTMAGAQLTDMDIQTACEAVKQSIREYMKEAEVS